MKFVSFFEPKKEFNFVGKFKPAMLIIVAIPIVSIISMSLFGINWGIDFVGGSEMQVKFSKTVSAGNIRDVLDDLGFEKNQVQSYGPKENNEMLIRVERMSSIEAKNLSNIESAIGYHFQRSIKDAKKLNVRIDKSLGDSVSFSMPVPNIADKDNVLVLNKAIDKQHAALAKLLDSKSGLRLRRTKDIGQEVADINEAILRSELLAGRISYTAQFVGVSDKISAKLSEKFGQVKVRRTDFVDSQVSKQLRTDGVLAVLYALLAILVYIAIRFDILFSPGAIVALVQDTLGAILIVFVIGDLEFDLPSIAALLTIVGYSINNTIVIYDRIREIMPNNPKKPLSNRQIEGFVNRAINETLSRTINTSLTTLIASLTLALLAGGVIRSFALLLSAGIVLGAFSSIFAAPATYLFLRERFASNKEKNITNASGISREEKASGVV